MGNKKRKKDRKAPEQTIETVLGGTWAAPPSPTSTADEPAPSQVPSHRGKRAITVYVEPEVIRRLKHLATDHDTTLQALGVEAFERLLAGR